MTKYNVHIYREMRLVFEKIEADTPEAAAAIARDKPTGDADDVEDCNGDDLSALVDVVGDEAYSQSVTIDFETELQRKAAPKLLAALLKAEVLITADIVRDDAGCLDQIRTAIAEAEAAGITPSPAAGTLPGRLRPYSVLLLYPDYACETFGHDTYYAFVEARDPIEAVKIAQRQAVAAQQCLVFPPDEFHPLLVTQGHHASEPLFNQ